MAYRDDKDLEVLQFADNEQLEILVKYLTKKKDRLHFNESLTTNSKFKEATKQGNLKEAWQEIAAELQSYGGHTVTNIFRGGKGVSYREIVLDLCKKMKIKINDKTQPINALEFYYIKECFTKIYSSKESELCPKLQSEFRINTLEDLFNLAKNNMRAYAYIISIVAEAYFQKTFGSSIFTPTLSLLSTRIGLSAILGLELASGLTPLGVLLVAKMGEPDYKITSQAVAHIAFLRILQIENINQEFEV